jgi:protein-S-isoprenylcysteine O-methyltransferase Ste14
MRYVYAGLIPALWVIWLATWAAAARWSKPTAQRESPASRVAYLVPLLLGLWLLVSPHVPFHWLNARVLPGGRVWFWLGAALVGAGLLWTWYARVHLGANWSAQATIKHGHELVRSGPYRWTRHPIYSAILLAFLGSAVALDEWRGLPALALITASFVRKLGAEERLMAARFPATYARYRAEVPALLPFARWRRRSRSGAES